MKRRLRRSAVLGRSRGFLLISALISASLACAVLAGCHARPYKGAPLTDNLLITVQNQGADLRQLEVDYPNASFGRDSLQSGAMYRYQPKIIGSGPIKVTFSDASGKSHSATGPTVQENERKDLLITIGQDESISFKMAAARTP